MSSDNGIYVLQTLDGWRVSHLQAIENIYWWPTCCDNPDIHETYACNLAEAASIEDIYYHEQCNNCKTIDPEWEQREQINPNTIYNYFKDSLVYQSEEEAMKKADEIYAGIINDDFCGLIEYGIQVINGLEEMEFPNGTNK